MQSASTLFGDRLREAIGNFSQRKFAELCDFSEGVLRNYLRGDTFPPLDKLENIAKTSGYNLAWLASGEGPKRPGEHVSQPDISFDSLGMAEGMSLLAKIYSSGDTTYVRAINANLAAFGEAIDNKVIARDTVRMMDEMKHHLQSLENRIMVLEKENAELAKIGEMRKAAANE